MSNSAKVTGIGGIFFKAKDPAALSAWYLKHLGISPVPTSYDELPWMQEAGPTVFSPFDEETEYFGRREQQWMINFRVDNLSLIVDQLRASDIDVEINSEESPIGRFARLHDIEGNPIELWEPAK